MADVAAVVLLLLGITLLANAKGNTREQVVGGALTVVGLLVAAGGRLIARRLTNARSPEADAILDALKRQP